MKKNKNEVLIKMVETVCNLDLDKKYSLLEFINTNDLEEIQIMIEDILKKRAAL